MTNRRASEILYQQWQEFLEKYVDYGEVSDAYKQAFKALEQVSCEDAISRKVVLDKIKEVCFSKEQEWVDFRFSRGNNGQRDFIIKFIESLPSVVSQSKVGQWVRWYEHEETEKYIANIPRCKCSECNREHSPYEASLFNYCPNCGARMAESEGENASNN